MTTTDIVFVSFVVIALTGFGSVLGFASWQESRRVRARKRR